MMARRKILVASPTRQLKQTTLSGFGEHSSAPSSPARQRTTTSKGKAGKRGQAPPPDIVCNKSSEQDDSDVGAINFEPRLVDPTDEDEIPMSPPKKRTRRVVLNRDGSPATAAEVVTPTEEPESGEEDVEVIRPSRKGKQKRRLIYDSDSEELRPRKRKLVKGIRPPSPDEDDILDDVDEDKILNTRLRIRGKRTAYQKSLEKLRKNRDKANGVSEPESSSLSSPEDDGEDNSRIKPFIGAKPGGSVDSDASHSKESEDDSFIVEDDGAIPAELPVDFSMSTHQDLAHHFKIISQFFVHLAVRPPAERGDLMEELMQDSQYFSVPLQIARRKLTGLMESVASSVWPSEFKNALKKYPDFELISLHYTLPCCDACRLGGRLSTLLGRLSGAPYERCGFEPLYSSDGDNCKQQSKEFHLGRFCARRTAVFHNFCHWEHNLFKFLCQEVDELCSTKGKRGFVRVAYTGGIQPPEDLSDADGIMDWLDQRKIIDVGWQRLQNMIDSASNLEMAKRNGQDND